MNLPIINVEKESDEIPFEITKSPEPIYERILVKSAFFPSGVELHEGAIKAITDDLIEEATKIIISERIDTYYDLSIVTINEASGYRFGVRLQ